MNRRPNPHGTYFPTEIRRRRITNMNNFFNLFNQLPVPVTGGRINHNFLANSFFRFVKPRRRSILGPNTQHRLENRRIENKLITKFTEIGASPNFLARLRTRFRNATRTPPPSPPRAPPRPRNNNNNNNKPPAKTSRGSKLQGSASAKSNGRKSNQRRSKSA